jgi:transcription-repair coupling factor (superfamily II helicase)
MLAQKLGFERLILKRGKMKCFFLENQDSPLYQSEIFTQIIAYIQNHPKRCSLKQTEKSLILTMESVHSLHQAIEMLKQMSEHSVTVN